MDEKDNVVEMPPQITEAEQKLQEVKAGALKAIEEADGVIIFAFKETEVDMNGQKVRLPKTTITNEFGCIAGGAISFPFASIKIKKVLDELHRQDDEQRARLSE